MTSTEPAAIRTRHAWSGTREHGRGVIYPSRPRKPPRGIFTMGASCSMAATRRWRWKPERVKPGWYACAAAHRCRREDGIHDGAIRCALYSARHAVPRDAGADGCDFAELSAPAKRVPAQFVSFAEIQKDPGLHFMAGGPNSERNINILLGKNVEAGRIVAGVTFSKPGNWTSWPPHEHAVMLEEAYLYIDMPAPGFGVQFV